MTETNDEVIRFFYDILGMSSQPDKFIEKEPETVKVEIRTQDIAEGAKLMECYRTDNQIIVCGCVGEGDESHDCDEMGCSFINHVVYRFNI